MIKNSKSKKIKLPSLLVFDFDGVLTNNKVIVRQDGAESVICCRSDGLGMEMARKTGLHMLILSKEINPVVSARGRKLKVEVIQAIDDKPKALTAYCKKNKIKLSEVLYVGNDLNDAEVMKIVGQSACPSDSHPLIKKIATLVLKNRGGEGAVRELIEERLGINTYL